MSRLMRAVLPAPFGPRIAVCSPARMVSVRPSRTRTPFLTTLASVSCRTGSSEAADGFIRTRALLPGNDVARRSAEAVRADYRFDRARDVKKEVIQKGVVETALR